MASIEIYIIDLNSYFRTAQSIHPLLNKTFSSKIKIMIHDYFERQYYRNDNLQSKFSWFNEDDYKSNRTKKITLSKIQKENIELSYDYIYNLQKTLDQNLLYDDIFCLAYAEELGLTVITDDTGMIAVAKEYGVKTISTLELLKIMFDLDEIDDMKIKEIVEYWEYNNDLPMNFNLFIKEFKRLFPKIKLSFLK
jgi:hypothetical protein